MNSMKTLTLYINDTNQCLEFRHFVIGTEFIRAEMMKCNALLTVKAMLNIYI